MVNNSAKITADTRVMFKQMDKSNITFVTNLCF